MRCFSSLPTRYNADSFTREQRSIARELWGDNALEFACKAGCEDRGRGTCSARGSSAIAMNLEPDMKNEHSYRCLGSGGTYATYDDTTLTGLWHVGR